MNPSTRTVVLLAAAGTLALTAVSFALSFASLRDLAQQSGTALPTLWPIAIDGLVIVATIGVVALQRHRWYAWTVLIGASIVSVAGNATHAVLNTPAVGIPVAVAVAVVPPVILPVAVHIAVVLYREHIDIDPQIQALKLLETGLGVREVAKKLDIAPGVVSKWRSQAQTPEPTPLHVA
ncbi:DUF2637 domain-containing protein [Rhodococcus sp. IEGM 1330]|uniref:DUF2637 domain-containing protein n=1 Tax=Rhodococcus sp. IEGM 1330 TaxID=3082225 RepID=UPI0029537978|nr:DUF2637 domain-containing protein [Rhodococcus sp. IEGM 1330]MDV8024972.1 DUF2637 domain-containing protein [Rhodococcus sp. IEGM 1330]